MSAAFDIAPAVLVSDADDKAAVLIKTGRAAIGMTIAEARFVSQKLARAADEAEYRLSLNKRLRQERDDRPLLRSFEQRMEDECGYHGSDRS